MCHSQYPQCSSLNKFSYIATRQEREKCVWYDSVLGRLVVLCINKGFTLRSSGRESISDVLGSFAAQAAFDCAFAFLCCLFLVGGGTLCLSSSPLSSSSPSSSSSFPVRFCFFPLSDCCFRFLPTVSPPSMASASAAECSLTHRVDITTHLHVATVRACCSNLATATTVMWCGFAKGMDAGQPRSSTWCFCWMEVA